MSSRSPLPHYPEFANAENKDALTPQPQAFDFTDPDKSEDDREAACESAVGRLGLFEQLVDG